MPRDPAISDEALMRLADGEAGAAEERAIRAAIESDPALADRFAGFVGTRAALEPNLPAASAPPPTLVAAVLREDEAASAAQGRRSPTRRASAGPPRWALPIAASVALLIGAGIGYMATRPDAGRSSMEPLADALVLLEENLGRSPSGTSVGTAAGVSASFVATYETSSGLCREFRLGAGTEAFVGASCRHDGRWRTMILVAEAPAEGSYRAAASGVAAVEELLAAIGAGPRLPAEREKELLR